MHGTNVSDHGATIVSPLDILPAAGAAAARLPLHCLVVEDNPTNQLVITLFLRKLGVTHDLVGRGAEALRAFADRRYDLVLMDIEMPQLDGYATTREIRRHESAAGRVRTPVIALSADALPDSRRRAREAGMDDFLTKPIAMDALNRAVHAFAGRPAVALVGA
jgi:CheY-like chemotaxis protein